MKYEHFCKQTNEQTNRTKQKQKRDGDGGGGGGVERCVSKSGGRVRRVWNTSMYVNKRGVG